MLTALPASVLVLAMTLAQAAPPADDKARAQVLLREGTALFDRGAYADALQKFEEAYDVFPSPKIWFNVGAADRALARDTEAMEAFHRFLAEAPDAPAASRREAQQAITELTPLLGRLSIECALPGVEVSVDGKPAGVTPVAHALWTKPGRYQIAGRREGMAPDVQEVTIAAGTARTVTLNLVPLPGTAIAAAPPPPAAALIVAPEPAPPAPQLIASPPAPPTPDRPITHRWWFWTAVGAVAAAGVIGVVLATRGGGTDVPRTTLGSQGFP